ncbi:helix-turn-helix domain-containing protein [Pseudarthrobacter sp. H2]|uniref:helix-turn-helix domain-containing protein n=1 Tax=Pseudarthrobacter sp. H2 TaxID=3418415 RepID=UPI003CF13035
MPEFHSDLPPMAPPPTLPRQRLRYTRILEVAAGFARKGLDSVVLSEVAAKADVPLGTLYRYFPSSTQLVLALYRKQLGELLAGSTQAGSTQSAGGAAAGGASPGGAAPGRVAPGGAAPGRVPAGKVPAHALVGVVMEIFHMRLMQPAVEQCLNRAVYVKDTDTTRLLRDIDSIAEKAVTAVSGDAAVARVLLLTVTGLVQAVRCRRLSLFEAEEDLKKACSLLSRARSGA